MARRNRSRSKVGPVVKPRGGSTRNSHKGTLLALGGVVLIGAGIVGFAAWGGSPREQPSRASAQPPASLAAFSADAPAPSAKPETPAPKSLSELLALPPEELANVDIAVMNLLCAQGLPGSENLDISTVLKTLDEWAVRIRLETAKYYPRFLRNPAENNNSEADFRVLTLISVLQLDLGVKYSPNRIGDYQRPDCDLRNSQDGFIHGMINSDNGGTCASLPVLYVAVGRRLGYPLKLVLAKEHVFVRWEDANERLNIEGSGQGMNTYPDEHYRTWPYPITDDEIASAQFLRSLTPAEELAEFLKGRGACLYDNGRINEARDAYAAAVKLAPNSRAHKLNLHLTEAEIAGRLVKTPNGLMPPSAVKKP